MNELVFLEPNRIDSEPFTTSDVVAECAKISRHAVQQMISRHENDISEFGRVAFEMRTLQTRGGAQEVKVYHLNEQQATLIITYLKNTEPVRAFKKELVRQFYAMRSELNRRHAERAQLKPIRREMTDVIRQVTDNKWAYKTYTDLSYKMAVGKIASKLREERGAAKDAAAVDYMTAEEIRAVTKTQYQIAVLLELGMDYSAIKDALLNRMTIKAS